METLAEKVADIVKPVESSNTVQDTEASPKGVIKELKECFYSTKDTSDFDEFMTVGKYPASGIFTFQVESRFLQYACGILKHTATGNKVVGNLVKITLFKNQIKLSGFNSISFSDIFIPLSCLTPSIQEEPIFFIFDYNILAKIVSSFKDENLSFSYKAGKNLLCMECGSTSLELATFPEVEFTNYLAKVKNIKKVNCNTPLDTLQNALDFLSIFAKKDTVQQNLSIIESRDTCFFGGTSTALGVYQTEYLRDNPLKLKYEIINICNKVIPYLYAPKTIFYETDSYFILRDQNVYIGFEKTDATFPNVKGLLASEPTDSYIVPRANLLQGINKVSVAADKSMLQLTVAGKGKDATLTIAIKDVAGRISKDVLRIERTKDCEDREYHLPTEVFTKVLAFHKSATVTISECRDKAVYIKDVETAFSTTAIIAPIKVG